MSIRARLLIFLNTALWFSGAIILVAAHVIYRGSLEAHNEASRQSHLLKWQVVCQESVETGSLRFMLNYAHLLELQPEVAFARFYLSDGSLLKAFAAWGSDPAKNRDPDVLPAGAPVLVNGREAGRAVLGFSERYRRQTLWQDLLMAWAKILFVLCLLAALNVVATGLFADRLEQRFSQLRAAADEIEKGNFSVRLPTERKDEFQFLAQHFNRVTERLSVLDRMKDEFIQTASHDLRNPLAAIKLSAEIIAEGKVGPVTDMQRNILQKLSDTVSRLGVYVTTILDAAKIKAGRAEYARQPFDVLPIVEAVADLYRLRAQQQGIAIETNISPSLPLLLADPACLEQALANLVNNALKFTDRDGRVTIAVRPAGDVVEISVSDTGIGISEENQSKLFQSFRQFGVSEQRAKRMTGTGLGLYTVKNTIEGMGGEISFRSKLGEGTTFTVRLPVVPV